ncbi:MAG: hypothetical protein HY536_00220 [Candidatus Colwellbacteria bacterium]|nr:hypothetical protein [Candidatus Colwellbacteria bacterium]
MNDNIERQLKLLSAISPQRTFTEESRRRIVGEPSRRIFSLPTLWESVTFGATMALTVFVAIVAVGAGEKSPVASSIRSLGSLENESRAMQSTITLTLKEANYYAETAQKASLALNEASKSASIGLDERLFEEGFAAPEATRAGANIDKLLEEATR